MTAPATQRVGAMARAWLVCGAMLSPLTAAFLWTYGLLRGRNRPRKAAGRILARQMNLLGPVATSRIGGVTIPEGFVNDARLSDKMNLEIPAEEWDRIYLAKVGPKADLSLFLRAAWSAMIDRKRRAKPADTDFFNLFGVVVNNSETPRVLRTLENMTLSHPNHLIQMLKGESPSEPAAPVHVTFVNANNFNLAIERPDYMKALRASDLVLPDGIGVKLALQMCGGSLRRNLNGTDLFPHLAALCVKNDWSIFLLGATNQVLAKAAANIESQHPGIRVAGMRDGYFKPTDEEALCRDINASGAMVLVIGMGTPRQELWAHRNAARLRLPLVLSMGGLIDFLGEKNKRAPMWMRQTGLEWVYRLVQEPGRMWKRYIVGNPVFLWRVRAWNRSGGGRATSSRGAR